jgi:glycerol-3-phosphate dehydrogenase
MSRQLPCVLILGAGINGAALARELVLNRVPVVLVDAADVSSGATSASSRLIHGGLRYLEHGEFDLVRESLNERTRLLRLAPQFVKPLELRIPVRNRFGGSLAAMRRFWGGKPAKSTPASRSRGLWLVRAGLRLYDTYAKDPILPRHKAHVTGAAGTLPVDAARFRWQVAFYDAQVLYPERFVQSLLDDARHLARQHDVGFELLTYRRTHVAGRVVEISSAAEGSFEAETRIIEPALVVNATGAWADATLEDLKIVSPRLIGGTKGSHFLTTHAGLRQALAGRAVYAEAADGRPFFIVPLVSQVMVGTTDVPFEGDPGTARATPEELQYLLQSVNEVFPQVDLTEADIDWHYSGVRPLPYVGSTTPAAITRRHWLQEHASGAWPCYSVIGGKLTTCRSLAEEAAAVILKRLDLPLVGTSRHRPLPGAEGHPHERATLLDQQRRLAERWGFTADQVAALWTLCGTRAASVLEQFGGSGADSLAGTDLPVAMARWSIRHEAVTTLDDLVERRLMLLYQPSLTQRCLQQLAALLVEAGRLEAAEIETAVQNTVERLAQRHGKRLTV